MGAAWVGLIGVGIGGVIGGLSQLIQAMLQRRWSQRDLELGWRHDQQARLFEFKRSAHTELLGKIEAAAQAVWAYLEDAQGSRPQPPDFYYLWDALSVVEAYGSPASSSAAREALLLFMQWVENPDRGDALVRNEKWRERKERYLSLLREDLGVEA